MQTGRVHISMTYYDAKRHEEMTYYGASGAVTGNVMQHKRLVDDVVRKIANFFAAGEFEEVDMYLDMLFMKDNTNMQRVNKEMFSDFIIINMQVPGVSKQDLDIFMKTHESLQ